MLKYLRRRKWFKKLVRKLYEYTFPYKTPMKWELSYQGYIFTIIDLSYVGEYDKIKIIEGDQFDGVTYTYSNIDNNHRRLTVEYILNQYSYLPDKMKKRIAEILEKDLDVPHDSMDEVIESKDYFFGTEEL